MSAVFAADSLWQFCADRGRTFTEIVARTPSGELVIHKKLSENPERYRAGAGDSGESGDSCWGAGAGKRRPKPCWRALATAPLAPLLRAESSMV